MVYIDVDKHMNNIKQSLTISNSLHLQFSNGYYKIYTTIPFTNLQSFKAHCFNHRLFKHSFDSVTKITMNVDMTELKVKISVTEQNQNYSVSCF